MKYKRLRIVVVVLIVCATSLALALAGVHRALQSVQPFYEHALHVDRQVLEQSGHELESRAAALVSDAGRQGEWNSLVTADQVNGWLAVKLAEQHSDLLPPDVHDPRIAIGPDGLKLGFETKRSGVTTVITIDVEPFLADSQSIGLRLRSVHAGAVPLPTKRIAEEFATAGRTAEAAVRWTQVEGDPVAMFDFAAQWPEKTQHVHVDVLELHAGEVYLAGHTRGEPAASVDTPSVDDDMFLPEDASVEDHSDRQANDQ